MNIKLSKILKATSDLTMQELMELNHAIISLIKTHQDVAFKKASIIFAKGDIVWFKSSSGERVEGIVTKKNPKTLQVTTVDNYYVNIPATYLTRIKSPSKKLLYLRKKILPTHEEMYEILKIEHEIEIGDENGDFH